MLIRKQNGEWIEVGRVVTRETPRGTKIEMLHNGEFEVVAEYETDRRKSEVLSELGMAPPGRPFIFPPAVEDPEHVDLKNIEVERIRAGMEKEEMAGLLKVSVRVYNLWLRSGRIPAGKLVHIAKLTGKSTDYLLGLSKE